MHVSQNPTAGFGFLIPHFREFNAHLQSLNRDAGRFAADHWKAAVAIMLSALGLAWLLLPVEMELLAWVQNDAKSTRMDLAKFASHWGDFHTGSLILVFSLWLYGLLSNRLHLRKAAVACLIAAAMAGISADFFKYGLGRARPNAGVADGFYGWTTRPKFLGFPSGHSSTAFATGVSLAVMYPVVAVPCIATAATVAWSRMYLNQHRPTDVLVGTCLGSLFGLTLGFTVRRSKLTTSHPAE